MSECIPAVNVTKYNELEGISKQISNAKSLQDLFDIHTRRASALLRRVQKTRNSELQFGEKILASLPRHDDRRIFEHHSLSPMKKRAILIAATMAWFQHFQKELEGHLD